MKDAAINTKRISLKEYAAKYNPVKTRRNHKMSWSYLYRLIRETEAGTCKRSLWFEYELTGEKDRILVILP